MASKKKKESSLEKYLKNAEGHTSYTPTKGNAEYLYRQNQKTTSASTTYAPTKQNAEKEAEKYRQRLAESQKKADELLKKKQKANEVKATNERSGLIKNIASGNYQKKATPKGMENGSALTQAAALTRIRQNVQDIQAMKTRKNMENLSEATDLQPTQQKPQTTGPVGMSVSQALAGARPKTESNQPKANAISGAAKTNVGNPQKQAGTNPPMAAPATYKGTYNAPKAPGAGGGVQQQLTYTGDTQKVKDTGLMLGYNRPNYKNVTESAKYARDLQKTGYYDDTDDYTKWTDGKLKTEYTAEKVKEEAYLSELANDPQGTMDAWNRKLYELETKKSKYEKIAAEGIEDPMRGGTITRRPDDYDTWQYLGNSGEATYMPSYYDSLIYDAIHGENTYADLYENGTDEEIDQAEIEIEDLWDRLENGGFMEMAEDPALTNEIAQTKALTERRGMSKRRKELEDEQSRRDTVKELTARAKGMEHKDTGLIKSAENWENNSGQEKKDGKTIAKIGAETIAKKIIEGVYGADELAKSYFYATQDPVLLDFNAYTAEPEHFMTPEERETFTLLYENDMKAEAQAFLDAIRTDLTARRRDFLQQTNIENASGEFGAVYGAGTVIENLINGPAGTVNSIKALLGDKRAQDKNDPSWDAQHYVQEVRGIRGEKWTEAVQGAVTNLGNLFGVDKKTVQAAAEKIGQIGGFANQVMYSMLDNAAAYLTTMGMGNALNFNMTSKFAEGMMQFIMSSEATASTMSEQLDNGKQPWEAAVMAIGSGLIEAATEKWSFEAFMDMDAEKLMKGVREAWKYIAKNFVAEGSEELTGFLGEQLMDQIVSTLAGHKSEIQARFEELGGDNEAFKKVMLEYAGKAATDFLAGGFAGAGQSSMNVARYGVQSYFTGRNVQKAEANYKGENGPTQLVNVALGMKEETESHKMGQGIQAKIDAGKKVSNFELGNLANMLYKEGGTMVQATAIDIVKKQAQEELKALGMKNPEMTAEAIAKQIIKGEVSKEEHLLISNSGAALQVMKGFMTNPEKLAVAISSGVKEAGSVRQAIQNVVSGKAKSSAAEGLVNRAYRNASIADKATAAMAKGKRTGATDAVRDGQVVQIKGIQFGTKEEKTKVTTEDGKEKEITSILDDSKVTIQTENGEETVSLDDIQAMDKDTGALLEFIKTNKGIISEQFANTVLNQIAQGKGKQQAGNILDSAMKIRLAAYTDSAMPRTDLDSATAEALWNDSRNEFEAEEKKRTEVRTTIKENQGSLTFEGAEFGTKRWEEKLKRSGLTRAQRDEANTLGEIAKRLGFRVNLINDEKNDAIFGWEERNTGTVYINLAGKDENGRSHSILTAAAHEFTHWIEQNSPNEYAKLRSYIIEQLKSQGKDVTAMLMGKVANYELYDQDINLSGAMAEMVADACDSIFSSQEMADKLQEINPTLFGKMKEFISDWIKKVRAVINNMKASRSYESMKLEKQVEEIARIWLGAREEAMNGEATPAAEAQAEETQKSVRQRDTEYMEAVEKGDMETEQRMVIEAAKDAGAIANKRGWPLRLYHGTRNFGFTVFDTKRSKFGTGAIFTTTSESVANGYSEFGNNRGSSSKYIEDDGTDKTIIRNAKNVLGQNWRKVNEQDVKRLHDEKLEKFKKLADVENEAMNESDYMPPTEIENEFWNVVSAFDSIVNQDEWYFNEDRDWATEYARKNPIINYYDQWHTLRDYFSENAEEAKRLRETGNKYYQMLLNSYEHSDALIELEYAYKNLIDTENKFINEQTESIQSREDLQETIENWKNKGNYTLYGFAGDKPLEIDAEKAHWTAIKAPVIGEGLYTTDYIVKWAKEHGYTSVAIKNVMDPGVVNEYGDDYVFFNENQLKSADPVTYDDNGKVIPLSERFNPEKKDIRYSVKQGEKPLEIRNDEGEPVATILPGNTIAETQFSLRSYYDDDERGKMIKAMKKAGYTKEQAEHWMESLDNIAKIMIADRMRYDFTADRSKTFLKENGDVYKKTLDASTMCKKTRLYNGTFNLVQHMLPNTILMPEDLIDLYNMMKEMDLETPCGMCYVQSRRRLLGPYTEEWLKEYKGEYIPTVDEVTTSDGLEKLKKEHPQAYTDFVDAMNSKGVNNPKLVQQRTDYRGDIRNLRQSTIDYLNKIGGLRIQSFSDFEVVHMLDMMQAVMDMKAKGLSAQAYTKVPEFAKIYGPTGIKINVSVLGSGVGVDHHGNLVMDNDEGMNWDTARELREMYPEDVGTVIVGINDDHIIAAMGNGEIDFIIPFHKSGWSKAELEKMKTLKHYQDYTDYQNEYVIQGKDEDGNLITKKAESNIDPLSYWKFELSGEENAEIYLAECAKNKLIPKFHQFLVDKGDGTYSLPQGKDQRSTNIREGYWKTLIDFKMYENDAYGRTLKDGTKTKVKGAPQKKVTPNFNMDAAMEILENYDGSHRTLPESEEAAKRFVKEYKKSHPLDNVRRQYSIRNPESHDVERWMAALNADSLESEAEKKLLKEFQALKMKQDLNQLKQSELKNEIAKIEALRKAPELTDEEKSMLADLKKRYDKTHHLPAAEYRMMKMLQKKTQSREATAEEKATLARLKNLLITAQKAGEAIAEQMYDVTGAEGFANMMYRQHKFIDDEIGDKTREELHETVERMNREADEIRKELEKTTAELAKLEGEAAVQNVQNVLKKSRLREMAQVLKSAYGTSMRYNELEAALAEIKLKAVNGESYEAEIEKLAQRVAETIKYGENETLKALRGLTITIGPGQQAELKGQNSNLNEIRKRLAGTGIKVVKGDYSTLEKDASDLHEKFTDMPDLGDEKDSLENFIRWVEGLKRNNNAAQQYGLDMDEVRAVVKASALNLQFTEETQATRDELLSAIKELKTNTAKAIERIKSLNKNVEKMIKAGKQAQGLSGVLQSDVAMTINYYNKIAKLAQETAKEKTLRETIIQLKSEAAEQLAKSNEEWRNLIERDKKARETNEKIKTNRNEISRAAKGLYKLWEQPKGLKNVPEELQPLVREAVKLLALNDLADNGMRFLKVDPERLVEIVKKLRRAEIRDGGVTFDYSNMADNNTNPGLFRAEEAIMVLPDLIRQWNTPKKGKNKLDTLEMRLDVAKRINECITDIQNVVRAAQTVNTMKNETTIANMADLVLSDTYTDELDENGKPKSRYFREMTGKVGRALAAMHKAIVSGNMTPEYFFRMLGNRGLSELWEGYHEAENRNGLELRKAQERIAQIAEKNGYENWDTKERHEIKLESGETVNLTTGQLMSLYATWKREKTVNPEMSMHLRDGGFYAEEQDLKQGILGKTEIRKRAHKFSDIDANTVMSALTKEQIQFVDDMVAYMSSDLAALGNEASMAAYGIKLYKEDYYFPMKMWDGVKNKKSNEAGSAAAEIDRAFHQSFTKARKNNANSALMIGDFMETVADHVSGMINFATMGLMNENLQKVLNYKIEEFTPNSPMGEAVTVDEETGEQEGGGGNTVKRNVRAKLEEAYGREAMDYLNELKKQLNGGAVRTEKSLGDKAISMFRKNAVAGSMSVAFQQPLSYLRAAMLINPKYLMKGIASEYRKGSYEERMQHSGVSVIKDMGRFDMNFGQSAREYLMPEGKESKFRKAWDEITDKATILPELMDRWTWNRMWVAVKAEQHDLHPEMDVKSDEFLEKCSERFNEVMRRTQVYDSVLVKSANMRSQNYWTKQLTSFMAEPTLTANVLMDAVRMAKNGEAGGKAMVAKASAIFVLSAVFQAAVKAAWSSGRSPDDKKTWLENFLNRFGSSLISEGDPLNLIPGYNDLITLFKKGELSDDAMGAIGKIFTAGRTGIDMLLGKEKDAWKAAEDSIGQLTQLFTNLPAKNISRDARAIYNWITGGKYANRPTSGDVLKWQLADTAMTADNLIGALNTYLEEAGWQTSTSAYTKRIYGAKKAGNEGMAESMENYLLLGKGAKDSSITSGIRSAIKADNSTTAAQKVDYLRGMTGQKDTDIASWVMDQYKDGNIDRKEAEALYKKANPKKTDDDAYWAFAKADQAMKTGETVDSDYFRIYEAMDANKAEDITKAVRELTAHGKKKENVRTTINSHYEELYLKAGSAEKVRIRDAMNKAYKALGYTTADVDKTIQGWTKKK